MNHPLFSVIIPTLNEEEYLPRLLTDLSHQKEKDFEVIIVDAHSDDGTKKYVENRRFPFPLKFRSVDKRSVACQRNVGASIATGSYLFFIDADTRITSIFMRLAKKYVARNKGLLLIPYVLPDYENRNADMLFQVVNFAVETAISIGKPISAGGQMIIERNFFQTIGGFDETLFIAEDHHIIKKAYQWGVHPKFARSLKVRFSLRRMKREGKLRLFYKYFIASTHFLLKGEVREKIFEYEMGGHLYAHKYIKNKMKGQSITEFVKKMQDTFKQLLSDE